MPIKPAGIRNIQTGVVAATPAADSTIKLQSDKPCSIAMILTAGSPATGAILQITNSSPEAVDAGTALWVNYDVAKTTSQMNVSAAGDGCELTGCRLSVTDGTWTLQTAQE